jgi:lipopolysaccharide export LptBFGC system permease protein LptF
MENSTRLKALRTISLAMTIIGIMGSLVLMTHAGRHNRSILLILLFTGWVSSPFLALLITYFSNHWPDSHRVHLYVLMIVIAFGSLIVYSGAFGIHGPHPAFVFMIIPLVSWLLIGIILLPALKRKM